MPGAQDRPYDLGDHGKQRPKQARSAVDHTITFRGTDQHGGTRVPDALVLDLATGAQVPLSVSGDTLTGTLAAGDYTVIGVVATGDDPFNPEDITFYADPTLTVAQDVDITLDARTALEVKAVSPAASAAKIQSRAALVQTVAGQKLDSYFNGDSDTSLHTFPSAGTTRPFAFLYMETQAEPLTTLPSPRVYHLAFPTTGSIPSTLTFTATPASLALANTTYATQGLTSSLSGGHNELLVFDAAPDNVWGNVHPVNAPGVQRVYFTAAGVRWQGNLIVGVQGSLDVPERQEEFRRFTAGGTYTETWNKAAFGPTAEVGHGDTKIEAFPRLTETGQVGHLNLSGNTATGTTGSLSLQRNGVNLGTSTSPLHGEWEVPATAADFRLDLTANRTVGWSNFAKAITARWTFRSPGGSGNPLDNLRPLLQARITGGFNSSGRAPKGTTFPLDVRVLRPAGGTAISSISLRASFNDGSTWSTASLTANGTDRWTARVTHPTTGNGYVALRFTANDQSGNSLTQTVTRAYGLY